MKEAVMTNRTGRTAHITLLDRREAPHNDDVAASW
jgi:hypothetical protein